MPIVAVFLIMLFVYLMSQGMEGNHAATLFAVLMVFGVIAVAAA